MKWRLSVDPAAGRAATSRAPSYLRAQASHQRRRPAGFVPAECPAFIELRNGSPQTWPEGGRVESPQTCPPPSARAQRYTVHRSTVLAVTEHVPMAVGAE